MINSNEFKTNPPAIHIYLFACLCFIFKGTEGRKSPKSQRTGEKRKNIENKEGRKEICIMH